jgi:hypothetical protein
VRKTLSKYVLQAFLVQIDTNLKYTNTDRANTPEVLCSLVFTPVSFNFTLRAILIGFTSKLLTDLG